MPRLPQSKRSHSSLQCMRGPARYSFLFLLVQVFFPIYFPIGCYATCTMCAYIVSHIDVKSFLNCYTHIFMGDKTECTDLFSLAFEHQCYQSGCHFFLSLLVSFMFNLILKMNILNVYAAALLLTSFPLFISFTDLRNH